MCNTDMWELRNWGNYETTSSPDNFFPFLRFPLSSPFSRDTLQHLVRLPGVAFQLHAGSCRCVTYMHYVHHWKYILQSCVLGCWMSDSVGCWWVYNRVRSVICYDVLVSCTAVCSSRNHSHTVLAIQPGCPVNTAWCPLHISRSDAPIVPRCCRRRIGEYASDAHARCHEIDHPPMPDHPPFANCAK